MKKAHKDKFEVGKWYKDRDGDFIKFLLFTDRHVDFTARVQNYTYSNMAGSWNEHAVVVCTPMTIEEMKQYLPEEEWWTETSNELFPIY